MDMKRILLLVLLPLIALSARAQGRHEFSVFLGGPATEVSENQSHYTYSAPELYTMYEPQTYVGGGVNFGVDYTYTLFKWLKVGVQVDISEVEFRSYYPQINGSSIYRSLPDEINNLWTAGILPEAKFFFLTTRFVKLYGKTAAGVKFALSKVNGSPVAFAYEIVPIGIQLGGQKVYFTSEIPLGSEVMGIRLGCGFRF